MKSTIIAAVGIGACLGALAIRAVSAQQPRSSWDGIYSEAQAKRGQPLYTEHCASCHGYQEGTPKAPAIMGPAFSARWQRKPIQELFDLVQTQMPYNSPGGLARSQNADIIAFMLQQSHAPAGPKEFLPPASSVGERTAARGLSFYTENQATRGKFAFDRYCARCHQTTKHVQTLETLNKPHDENGTNGGFAMSFGAPFLDRVYYGKPVYPSVYYLYDKLRYMPAFDARMISAETRADIIAHILKMNDFPAGPEELRPDPEAMKQMMLQEPGFERIFNGKDFNGIRFVIGPECEPAPKGCGKTDPGSSVRVENGAMVCACPIHGYWYTEKQYKNFEFRMEYRFVKPADWTEAEDSDLFWGQGGILLFIHEHHVWPKMIEVEGRWHDFGDIYTGSKGVKFRYDRAAKLRAQRSPWVWNDVRIVSKDGRVDSYLNGQLISTVTEHGLPAGHIGMQMEGTPSEWRNIRIKGLE